MDNKDILNLETELLNSPYDIKTLTNLITLYIKNKLFHIALLKTNIFIQNYGNSKKTAILLAKISYAQQEFKTAYEHWLNVLEFDSQYLNGYFQVVNLSLKLNLLNECKIYIQEMKIIDINHKLTLLAQARFYYQEKNWEESIKYFNMLIHKSQYIDESFYKLINIYIIQKDFNKAIEVLDISKSHKFNNSKRLFLYGRTYFGQKKYTKALQYFQCNIEENDQYIEQSYIGLIKSYYKLYDIENADKYLHIAKRVLKSDNLIKQLETLSLQILDFKNKVLLIGTCRIKRMRTFIEDVDIKKRISLLSSHVHYADEINQILGYITEKKNIPKNLIGLVIDDINVGKLNSFNEIEEWKKYTNIMYKNSRKVIIEISSIKKYLLMKEPNIYGSITSINNVIYTKKRFAKFINAEMLQEKYKAIQPEYINSQVDLKYVMKEIKSYFPSADILWVSHFRYSISENKTKEIIERKILQEWVSKIAKSFNDSYLDQTFILKNLGQDNATIDSSHYSVEGEKLMAKIITFWIQNNSLPKANEL